MLKIAQVAPLWENIPPHSYGGTERVVHSLTEELVRASHEVTLFACGTSQTSAHLISVYPRPLVSDNIPWTNVMYPLLHLTEVFDHADDFDIIHIHLNKASDYFALPLAKPLINKVVFTLHFPYPKSQGREDRHLVMQKYKNLNYVSISNAQRRGGENLHWVGTVYNGIDLAPYTLHTNPKDYVFWLGKFNPDKGVREAILAAKEAGMKIILGGKIDQLEADDHQYYEQQVKPLIDGKQIVYVGELNDKQKNEYFGGAQAFLNPIQWNEPFGLTMVEAMACGTPVIAYAQGAAPELIIDGETGFLVNDVAGLVKRLKNLDSLDRRRCRQHVEERFTAATMAAGYLDCYKKLLGKRL